MSKDEFVLLSMFNIVWKIMANGGFSVVALFQIVPGRMGMLVTLFLSLTALLVSTISSSPEVLKSNLELWWIPPNLFYDIAIAFGLFSKCYTCSNIFDGQKRLKLYDSSYNSGVPRYIRPHLLGACPLFLHLWCNCCLRKSTSHTEVRVSSWLWPNFL